MRVVLLEMQIVLLGVWSRVAALLTYVHLLPTFLVLELKRPAVHLLGVRLERAALCECLVAQVTLVWTHT